MSGRDPHGGEPGRAHPAKGRFGEPDPDGWAESPALAKALVPVLLVLCLGLIAADLGYHKHGHYSFEEWIGFHGLYGFGSFVFLVLVATQMRKLVQHDQANPYREDEGGLITPLPLSRFPEDAEDPASPGQGGPP